MSDPQEVPAKPETFVVNKVGKTQLTMVPAILGENSGRSMLYYTHTHTFCLQCKNPGLIPKSGRSPGEEHGKPFQYSCLENSMYRGTWRATVHAVEKSRT